MFYQLLEELLQSLPTSVCQRRRVETALAELDTYRFQVLSDEMREACCSVTTPGGTYLTFSDQCTCGDWSKRNPITGTGEIEICKHVVAAHVTGNLVEPAYWPAELLLPVEEEGAAEFVPSFLLDWTPDLDEAEFALAEAEACRAGHDEPRANRPAYPVPSAVKRGVVSAQQYAGDWS